MAPAAKQASAAPARFAANWPRLLTWFVRIIAVVWFVKGLLAWAVIFGVDAPAGRPFDERGLTYQTAIVFFAVGDVVASVGLWLLAPWGGVVWIGVAAARVALSFVAPAALGLTMIGALGVGVAIVAFIALTWAAGRGNDRR